MARFRYTALNQENKEIRILRVHPASSSKAPIQCTLLHVALKSTRQPEYETVSYCWGDTTTKATIVVNSRTLETTASAELVLRRMRLVDRTRAIWIDAICINQSNDTEKTQQVALMAEIYSNTTRNLIWFGPEGEHTKEALAAITDVTEDACLESDDFQRFELFKNDKVNYSHRGLAVKVNSTALLAFFDNPWFERVWVVQEAVLAPFSLCHYGSYEIPLPDVLYLAAWLLHKSLLLPFRLSQGMHNARAIWVYKYSRYRVPSMIQSLENLRNLKCKDPRDHIYGILGIHHHSPGFVDESIIPDYQKSLADVLTEATNLAIAERLDLYFLHLVSHRQDCSKADNTIPSWVPRWDRAVEPFEDPAELRYIFQANGSHGHRTSEPGADLATRSFRVKGVVVCSVKTIWPVIKRKIQVPKLLEMIGSVKTTMSGDAHLDSKLAKTLVAGTTIDYIPTKPEIVEEQYPIWRRGIQEHNEFPPEPSLELEASDFETKGAIYHQAFCNACFNRRLFKTESGALGLGPQNLQPEDFVVVIWGCYWPMIFRPTLVDGKYNILGAAFVDGIMNGEAVPDDSWDEDDQRAQTFVLL